MKIDPKIATPSNPEIDSGLSQADKDKIKKVSRSFESLFVNQLVGEMRKTVNKGGFVQESQGERVYQSMLDSEYSKSISESDQIGLSKIIYEHLLRINSSR